MSSSLRFPVALDQPFDHLPLAPVVEAVVQFRARISSEWDPAKLRSSLAERLPQFATIELQQRLELEAFFSSEHPEPRASRRQFCHAIRAKDAAGRVIAQFSRDGLVFSQLKPFPGWEICLPEAQRVWDVFADLTQPTEIERLGIRFINRIEGVSIGELASYLKEPPSVPRSLPLNQFLYQSTFDVPGYNFGVNVIKSMQPAGSDSAGLTIDIDVFTTHEIPCSKQSLDELLPTMRWLKNMVFFELLTAKVIDSFRGPNP